MSISLPLYHPYCHLINGERLHYLLIKTRVVSVQIRATIDKVIAECLGKCFKDATCLYQVFGETDLILRIWASRANVKTLLAALRQDSEIQSVKTLLIRTMRTWYQSQIESEAGWDPERLGAEFERIVNHRNLAAFSCRDDPESNDQGSETPSSSGRDNIRFFILCEQPYETHVSAFNLCRDTLDSWLEKQFGRAGLLKKFSIYGYSTRSAQGVLVKGYFRATKYSESTNALTRLVNRFIASGLTTTTLIVCATFQHGRDNVIEKRGNADAGGWRDIVSNLLCSLESNPDFYLSPEELALEGPAASLAVRTQQERRGQELDSYIKNRILRSLRIYHSGWWDVVEEMRLLYRWVVAGPPKNEQLRAVMMKGYADMEGELNSFLRRCVVEFSFLTVRKKKLFNDLNAGPLKGLPAKQISAVVNHVFGDSEREALTLQPICVELGRLREHSAFARFTKMQREAWSEFLSALSHGSKDRNDLMHGNEVDMFTEVKRMHNSKDDEDRVVGWARYVINYMHIRILFPMIRIMLERLTDAGCRILPSESK